MSRRFLRVAGLMVAFALVIAACGDDDTGTTAAPSTQATTTTEAMTTTTEAMTTTTEAMTTTTEAMPEAFSCGDGVTIGVITDQTGQLAIYGSHIMRSVPIGFAYATDSDVQTGDEQHYMLGDCDIRVLYRDDQSDPELSATAARELIEVEGADILIGSVSSGVTATLQGIARENDVILIVAPAAATDITGKDFDPNTFRTSRSNYQDGMAICDQFVNNDGYTTFVQIAPDYSFGYGGAQAYRDSCTFYGGEFIHDDIFAPFDTTDFTTYLEPLAGTDANAFLVTWAGGGFVPLYQAAVDLGVIDDNTVLGSPFVDNVVMPLWFSGAVGTTSLILYWYGGPDNAANDFLVEKDQEVFGVLPDLFDGDGMSAAIMAVEGLKATGGASDAESLRAAFEGMTFEGAKGTYYIRPEDHMAIQDMYIVTLTGFDPDTTFPIYENVAVVRPEPPCLLEGDYVARCGDLPVGTLG